MKRVVFCVASIAIVIIGTTGFIMKRRQQVMQVLIHSKGLPSDGLALITPADPQFDSLAATLLSGATVDEVNSIKPFTAIILNTGDRVLVAYTIVWETVDQEGRMVPNKKTYSNSSVFISGPEALQDLARTGLDKTAGPGSAVLVSLMPLPRQSRRALGGASFHQGDASTYTEISISLDGAFFDDGTFVGPDTTNFFTEMNAQVDAERDVINSVAEGLSAGKNRAEVFQSLASNSQKKTKGLLQSSGRDEVYEYFKKFYSTNLLKLKDAFGDEHVLRLVRKSRPTPHLALRKRT